jgi:dCMP deaminase
MKLAEVASLRSEDPFRQVGAAAFDESNRVVGVAYNGLMPGYVAGPGFWDDRDARQKFMLHAEQNLCSLFRRGDVKTVAVLYLPCIDCMRLLCAHDVKTILYRDVYLRNGLSTGDDTQHIAEMYGITLNQIE